jgi:hypothetical protein
MLAIIAKAAKNTAAATTIFFIFLILYRVGNIINIKILNRIHVNNHII